MREGGRESASGGGERETQGSYEDSGCSNGRIDIGKEKGGRQDGEERKRRGMKRAEETC